MRFIVLYIAIIFIASCAEQSVSEIFVNDEEVLNITLKKLRKQEIDYRFSEKKNIIYVDDEDYQIANDIYRKSYEKVFPVNRHASFPVKIQSALKAKLNEKNYKYNTICSDNIEWIVWEEEDTEEINRIIDQVIVTTIEKQDSQAVIHNNKFDLGKDISPCLRN